MSLLEVLAEMSLFFLSLIIAGFFAYLETAYTSLRSYHIEFLESKVSAYPLLYKCWRETTPHVLASILIMSNLAHVVSSLVITEFMHTLFGSYGLFIAVPFATLCIFLFGEILPKMYAKSFGVGLGPVSLYILNLALLFLYKPIGTLLGGVEFVTTFFGFEKLFSKKIEPISDRELKFLIEQSEKIAGEDSIRPALLLNLIDVWEKPISCLMISATHITFAQANENISEVAKRFFDHKHLAILICEEGVVTGVVSQGELINALNQKRHAQEISNIGEQVIFVYYHKKVNVLAKELISCWTHAVVVDEYGTTVGIITPQTLCEGLLGIKYQCLKECICTFELEEGKQGWLFHGQTPLSAVEAITQISFKEITKVPTLSSFLIRKNLYIPRKGDRFFYKGHCFQVQQGDGAAIQKVLIFNINSPPPLAGEKINQIETNN